MGRPVVVIAPDSFKGSVTAAAAARALGEGWLRERPGDDVRMLPMADGGEGTLDVFALAHPASERMPICVTGPDGRPVRAEWLRLPDGTGVIELASTSGIGLIRQLDPLGATTAGFGEAIAAALDSGVERLILALGGSASTDGGTGALTALGARFVDSRAQPIPPGGAGLALLATADLSGLRTLPRGGVVILADVVNPLAGSSGAAHVFAPQKGASPQQVAALDAGVRRLARVVGACPGQSTAHATAASPGAGAAGGLGFGLLIWGATMTQGSRAVADLLRLPEAVAAASVVITGEGRFDEQSGGGKVPSHVLALAAERAVPAMLVAGTIATSSDGFEAAVSLADAAGSVEAAMAEPCRWLAHAAAQLARTR